MAKDRARADAPGSRASTEPQSVSAVPASIPRALASFQPRLPEGLRWSFETTMTKTGRVEYTWKLTGPRGGIHVSAWPDSSPRWDRAWLGGIEGHSPIPRDYESETPSHEHCWLIGGPCWHDGSSLQFSEQVAPYLPDPSEEMRPMDHALVLSEMVSRYNTWLPDAQAIEARRAETAQTGSVADESAVAEPCADEGGIADA